MVGVPKVFQEQEQEFVAKEEDYSKQPANWLEDFEIPMKRFIISHRVGRKVICNSQVQEEEQEEQAWQAECKQECFEESIA
jgi:hypothetical protein